MISGKEFGNGIFCKKDPSDTSEFGRGGFKAINFSVSFARSEIQALHKMFLKFEELYDFDLN